MPLHAFRSRSSSKTGVRPRMSIESHDSSSSVLSVASASTAASSTAASTDAYEPHTLAGQTKHALHPSMALYPFLGNLQRFSAAPGEDIDLWLAGVDAVAQHVGAPADAPVPLIPLLLRGDAFRRFVRMHHETRGRLTSWDEWRDRLRLEFRAAGYLAAKTDELAARGWRPAETLAHYFDARRELQMVVMPGADEEELVQDVLSGVPLRQRRLVVDTIPPAQRAEPTLAVLRRAMADCEVEMRGRDRLRGDRVDASRDEDTRRAQSHSSGHAVRTISTRGQAPPSSFSLVMASAPLSPPQTPPARNDFPPPPTITISG